MHNTHKTIATHSGIYHADDVFAVATLRLLFPGSKVIRSREEEAYKEADFIVDVGGMYEPTHCRFDHHQSGFSMTRPNGIPYASFGLVWKEFGEALAGSEGAKIIDQKLISPIDALDNGFPIDTPLIEGIKRYDVSDVFNAFMQRPDSSEEDMMKSFMLVVEIAQNLILKEIENSELVIEARIEVEKDYRRAIDKRIVTLAKLLPWKEILSSKKEPLIVIFPRTDGRWAAQSIPISKYSFIYKQKFPANWAGKTGEDLAYVTGVKDAVFCHNDRFIAVAKTYDGALTLANMALEETSGEIIQPLRAINS
jgi:uncharacterized UPF0160 family protein